jgi:DNA/RNA-binding domain of Phe-tRNA-synthetase-like protein
MKKFKISIAPELIQASGGHCKLGVLVTQVTVNPSCDALYKKMAELENNAKNQMTKDSLSAHEGVKAARSTYENLKVSKMTDKKPSQEALWLRLIEGKSLYKINNVVDAQNIVSIQAVRSIGSYDVDKLEGDITFRPGAQGEQYPSTKKRSMDLCNLPLLSDKQGPFGSPTSDSERALIQPTTKTIVSVIYSFDRDRQDSSLHHQLNLLRDYYVKYCHAKDCSVAVICDSNPVELTVPCMESDTKQSNGRESRVF